MGAVVTNALNDPTVVEVMANPDGKLWLDKLGVGRVDTGEYIKPVSDVSAYGTDLSLG